MVEIATRQQRHQIDGFFAGKAKGSVTLALTSLYR
jgi:hypothetical protein